MLKTLKEKFESAFDVPFTSAYGLNSHDLWYDIGPKSNMKEYFKLHLQFVNDIRLTMELVPDEYSVPFIADMSRASEEKKRIFTSFAHRFIGKRAKVSFSINHAPADSVDYSDWAMDWSHVGLRISRSPITNDYINHEAIILDWGIPMMGMVLSLANIVPLEPAIKLGVTEGTVHRELTNRYERSPINRTLCLFMKGYNCSVCGMNFKDKYGDLGFNYIHVHHSHPVSQMGDNYLVDPATELYPVCPNCHAMLHRRNPPLSIEELKRMLASTSEGQFGGKD